VKLASPPGETSSVSDMQNDLLGIGATARRSGLTVKALRYYDRVGLLHPAVTDDATGFRYYSGDQVATAWLIGKLRSVDLPLDDIRLCLESEDRRAAITRTLSAHESRLESRVNRLNGNLHILRHFLAEGLETEMAERPSGPALPEEDEREIAKRYFNAVWDLMEKEDRTVEDDDLMLHMAHASRYHWGQVGKPENLARGEWQCSRVYAVLRRVEPCLHHAQRVLDLCLENGIGDWDIAFAYEALARANAIAGDSEAARAMTERALEAVEAIKEDEDRKIVMTDLESIPGQKPFW
jgi:DNA-binding transcriptional MerR regulator